MAVPPGRIRRIAVLTSGGDAPGMNAAVRAVVRRALADGVEVLGVRRGFSGLLAGDLLPLGSREVGGILRQGGTFLGTARSGEFRVGEGVARGLDVLGRMEVDALVVIGGDGSMRGALALHRADFRVAGIPATIDNDLAGTDMCIGTDTALNTAVEAIDKLKDTASAHNRVFAVEVMGRNSGYLALVAGIAVGAELVLVPEVEVPLDAVVDEVAASYRKGKPHFIMVVAEGTGWISRGLAQKVAARIQAIGYEMRLTVLGHVQRGGSPSAFDRLLASRFGVAAVERLMSGTSGEMVGLHGHDVGYTPLDQVDCRRTLDPAYLKMARILAR